MRAIEAAEIFAEVTVEGDLSGQLAIGNNIVQVRVDTVHGDLVTLASGEIPVARARPRPVSMLPRRPDPMFDRRDETARVLADAAQGLPVTVGGPSGIGTSTLLRYVATEEAIATRCGGVAFLPAGGLSRDDTLQVLFEVFYDCEVPLRPSPTRVRHLLQDARAAIVLDDVALTGRQLRELVDAAPTCGFVVARQRGAERGLPVRAPRRAASRRRAAAVRHTGWVGHCSPTSAATWTRCARWPATNRRASSALRWLRGNRRCR